MWCGSKRAFTARMIGSASPSDPNRSALACTTLPPAARRRSRCAHRLRARSSLDDRRVRGGISIQPQRARCRARRGRRCSTLDACRASAAGRATACPPTSVGSTAIFTTVPAPLKMRLSCARQASISAWPDTTVVVAPCCAQISARDVSSAPRPRLPWSRTGRADDGAATGARWRSASPARRAMAQREVAQACGGRSTVATTVCENGAIGDSLNVALVMTASVPNDPHISFDRS